MEAQRIVEPFPREIDDYLAAQLLAWRRERVSVEQAEARLAELDRSFVGGAGRNLDNFRRRVVAGLQPGDELWLYDSGPESWANLGGEMGIMLVRAGRPLYTVTEMDS